MSMSTAIDDGLFTHFVGCLVLIGDARPRQCPALPLTVAANRPVRKIVLVRVIDRKNRKNLCLPKI